MKMFIQYHTDIITAVSGGILGEIPEKILWSIFGGSYVKIFHRLSLKNVLKKLLGKSLKKFLEIFLQEFGWIAEWILIGIFGVNSCWFSWRNRWRNQWTNFWRNLWSNHLSHYYRKLWAVPKEIPGRNPEGILKNHKGILKGIPGLIPGGFPGALSDPFPKLRLRLSFRIFFPRYFDWVNPEDNFVWTYGRVLNGIRRRIPWQYQQQ